MVEWKPLYSIVKSITTGLNPRQNFVLNEDNAYYYYVTVKEITTNKVVFSDSTDKISKKAKEIINNRSKLEKGDILFSGIGTIGKVAYVDFPTTNWDCSESVFVIKPLEKEFSGKFLSYILSSNIAKNQYERGASGAIMKGVRKATLENLHIPVPTLSEQQRIVGILDTFTASIDNLKEQIAQRRKQYEYYRDQLLDLEGKPGVEMKTLAEICSKLTDGSHYSPQSVDHGYYMPSVKDMTNSGFVFSNCKQISKEDYESLIKAGCKPKVNDVLIAKDGSMLKYVFPIIKEEEIVVLSSIAILTPRTDLIKSAYLAHYLKGTNVKEKTIREYSSKGGVPRIILKNFKKVSIFIPSIPEQQRIVSILDTFEASIQNLEAQLNQREKQYEFYRNKLLTFE